MIVYLEIPERIRSPLLNMITDKRRLGYTPFHPTPKIVGFSLSETRSERVAAPNLQSIGQLLQIMLHHQLHQLLKRMTRFPVELLVNLIDRTRQ